MFYSFERTQHVFFLSNYFLTSKQKKLIYSLAKKQKGKQFAFKNEGTSSFLGKNIFHIISEGSFLLFTPDKNESFPFHDCGRFFLLFFCERQPHHN